MTAFPSGFVWGAATSAFQIEGGVALDGRGPSIWDTLCAQPGRIRDGSDGAVAADHRNRWRDDVALLAQLGVPAYRFSVSWPRVQPEGRGRVSEDGLDFYRELVDGLLAVGIEPVVTLYHWDLPQALEDDGGWPVRATAERFADYAAVVAGALGDRVCRWCTVNEPWCASMLGYAGGQHAPGRQEPGAAVAAAHHLLLGHGLATDAIRAEVDDAEVAITLNPYPVVAAGERAEDLDAVRRVDGLANRLWYDPVLRGAYPDDVLDDLSSVSSLEHVRDGDLVTISRPIDALGVNYYRRHHVRHSPGASAVSEWPGSPDVQVVTPPGPVTDGGWAIEPAGLTECLVRLRDEYDAPPLYVHENGAAFSEPLDDQRRLAFLADHLRAAHDAIAAGVDLRGYFVWSLLDNFEWAEGYLHRFGIVHVDYDTQVRTPKASARWYSEVVRRNALD
jgi:beta-glucosidase